jgi:hypothetical protein
MSRNLQPRRYQSHVRRQPTQRFDGPPLQTVQVLAACLMAICLVAALALLAAPGFAATTLEIHGAKFTSQEIVASIVGFERSPNLFGLAAQEAAVRLADLPAVESASVRVQLPSTIVVTLTEREPKLIWAIGANRYAVDSDGLLFGFVDTAGNPIPSSAGPLSSATPGEPSASTSPGPSASAPAKPKPTPTAKKTATPKATPTRASGGSAVPTARPVASLSAAEMSMLPSLAPLPTADARAKPGQGALALPIVFDRRTVDADFKLGDIVDPVNLDVGYRLANLTPLDMGSSAASLAVSVDDTHGFTVSSVPAGWVAEFGFYAPTVREVSVIPEQVRDLRSLLLAYGDAHVRWVWLVADVSSSKVNTYIPR